MIPDSPEIRKQLSDQWQKVGVDLVKRGFRPEAVFETMLTVGIAGYVGIHGNEVAADKLLEIARHLSDELRMQAEAITEAAGATKN